MRANDRLLTAEEAAVMLGVSPASLATWRCRGQHGIPFVRIGVAIRYDPEDLRDWVDKQKNGEGPR